MLGVMLDCSRNAVMKVSELKKFILNLEKMGYKLLQLYTEDTYEIEGEPLFGYMRGRYTEDEIKEIDTFCSLHNIELMPCIQTLAHLNQLLCHPYYSNVRDLHDILLVGEEKTYELIDKMFSTCAKCFKSRRINIGMDEAYMLGLGKYLDRNGYKKREDVLLEHLTKVCAIAEKYGFTPVMWSDMFFRLAFADYYNESSVSQEVIDKVPKNLELCYWNYYSDDKKVYDTVLDNHLKFNNPIWFAGGAWKWMGFQSSNVKTFSTTAPALQSCRERNIENILITLWGDNGNECPLYATLPGLVYASECVKGNYSIENAKRKFSELFSESWDDFMLCDLTMPNDIPKRHGLACGAKEMLYTDYFLGKYDCSVLGDGREVAFYKEIANKFSKAKNNTKNYKLLFAHYESLCLLMSEKYDLGFLTRKAYQERDIAGLKQLIKRYTKVEKYLNKFIEDFRALWYHDNKPHGFDVQDIRLGGVMQRTKSCKERLKLFVAGKIKSIPELEEKLVDYFTGSELNPEVIATNDYHHIASVNIL